MAQGDGVCVCVKGGGHREGGGIGGSGRWCVCEGEGGTRRGTVVVALGDGGVCEEMWGGRGGTGRGAVLVGVVKDFSHFLSLSLSVIICSISLTFHSDRYSQTTCSSC